MSARFRRPITARSTGSPSVFRFFAPSTRRILFLTKQVENSGENREEK